MSVSGEGGLKRGAPEVLAKHLREAVETLGYFDVDALPALLGFYQQRWDYQSSQSMLTKDEVAPLLSDKGRANPRHAQAATFNRATFNVYREADLAKDEVWLRLGTEVRFSASVKLVCNEARSKDGTTVPIGERWPLPLPGCGQEWCPCNWRLVYVRKSKRGDGSTATAV